MRPVPKGYGLFGLIGLGRNKGVDSTKQDVVMEFYGLPPIGQKQRRPMDGVQFHPPWLGDAGERSNLGHLKSVPAATELSAQFPRISKICNAWVH
jgi:hypothetical protein